MIHRHRHLHSFLIVTLSVLMSVMVGVGSQHPRPADAATNIDITGVIWDFDPIEYLCDSNGNLTVRVRVNGGGTYSGTCSDDTGEYTVTGVSVDPSDVITVFVDDASVHAVYVTKAAASPTNMTLDLYQGVVYLSHADAGPITNANIDLYDSGQNANIDFTVTSNNLTLTSGTTLSVATGKSYVPGGSVIGTLSYVYVESGATMTLGVAGSDIYGIQALSGTLNINADSSFRSGGIYNGSGTVTTTSGTPTVTLSSSGSITGSMTFHNLTVTGASSYSILSSGSTVTVNGSLTVENGVTVDQRSNLIVSGSLITSGTGTLLYGSGTPTTTVNGAALGGGSGNITFYNLTKSASGTLTWSGSGRMSVANTLTVSSGTLDVTATRLILGGTVNTSGGALIASGGTIVYASTSNSTIPTSGSYTHLALSDGLVGYWKLDETSGSTSNDLSGFGHSGAHTASPTISSDVPTLQYTNDRSIDFNGSSQFVDLGNPDYLNNQFGDKITVSAWIKPDVNKSAVIIGKSDNAAHSSPFYTYSLFQSGNILSWRVGSANINSSGSGTGALIVDGTTWQHVVGTYDGTTMRSYINGIEVSSGAKTGNVSGSTQNARIGARHTTSMSEYFDGKIDEARIYRRGLSAQEVRALAAGNHPGGSGATFTLGGNLDVNGDLTIGSGTLDADNSQNYNVNVTGNLRNFGVLQPRNGTVTLDGTSTGMVVETGQQHFRNFTVAGSGGEWTLRDRLWATGTLAVSNGTLDVSTNNYRIHAGTINQTGGTITPRSGTVIVDSQSAQTLTATSTLNNLRVEDPSESSLGGYWKLDELAGSTAKDFSGNANDGTLTNAPAWTTSLNGTITFDNAAGLDLDGTDDYVAMGDVLDANDSADLTISGWFNRDTATTDDVILAKRNGNSASDTGYIVWIDASTDKLRFEASDGTDEFELASTSTFTSTGWHRFVVVWDQDSTSNSEIFIDGVDDNAAQTGTIGNVNDLSSSLALRIGAESDAGAPYDGKVDDIRVYTSALSTTQVGNLGAGKYADGSAGTATFTLGGNMSVGGTLTLDSGVLDTSTRTLTVTNAFTLATGNGSYTGGSLTQTFTGGLTVSGSTFTGGSGTIDSDGSVVLSGGTVTTGSGTWLVGGSYTHSGSTMTYTAGNTLTMDGTGTLTSNGQTLQNLTITPSGGAVTLANATHTVSGNLVLGGGTITPGTSTVLMSGTGGKTITGGGKTLQNLTIDPGSSDTVTLQTSDLTVSALLSVASSDTFAISSSRSLFLSGVTGTTLTLTGTINGAGTLYYANHATTMTTSGTLDANVIFSPGGIGTSMTIPNRIFGANVTLVPGSSSTTFTIGAATINGNLRLDDSGAIGLVLTNSVSNVTIGGDLTAASGGAYTLNMGSGSWSIAGDFDLTNVTTFNHNSGTVVMTGTSDLIGNNFTLNHLTINGIGATVSMITSDAVVAGTLTIGGAADGNNDTLSIASGRTLTSETSGTVTFVASGTDTITGSGTLKVKNSNLDTDGTLSSLVQFDGTSGSINMPARTYGGNVEIYNNSGASARVITMQSGTHTLNGDLNLNAANTQNVTLNTTGNPTVDLTGNFDFTGAGAGNEVWSTGSGLWTITGNIDLEGSSGSVTATNVTMNGSTKTLRGNNQTFGTLTFAGTATITSTNTNANVLNVNASSAVTIDASRNLSVDGSVSMNASGTIDGAGSLVVVDATLPTAGTISTNVYFQITLGDYTLPNRTFSGSTRLVNIQNDGFEVTFGSTSSPIVIQGTLNIDDTACGGCTYTATAGNPNVTIGGDFSFTPSTSPNVHLGSGTWSIGGNFDLTSVVTLQHNNGTVAMTGTSKTLTTDGLLLNNLTTSGTIALAGATTLAGDLTISAGTLTAPSGTLTLRGNVDNNGTFAHNNGTVVFTATATGKTIEAGASTFHNVQFNSGSGGWTIQTDNMTVAGNLTLTAASSFAVASGRTLEVQGTFTNDVGGSPTTWTGSTLYLNGSGGVYDINTKSAGNDAYGTLRVGASEDIAMWNSSATTVTIDTGGSLLSQDHAGTDGRLHAYGTINSRANEYWSYTTDFDGSALGISRQADIRFENGATLTVDNGDTLTIAGDSSNRTLVTRQSSGSYGLIINGTIDAEWYRMDYLSTAGVVIGSGATVTELSNGIFDNSIGGSQAAYISVSGITSTKTFTSVIFDSSADGTDSNVTRNVSANGSGVIWTFVAAAGVHAGATYEYEQSGASLIWATQLNGVNDGDASDVDVTTSTTQLSANWSINLATDVDEYEYAIGTSIGGSDVTSFTSNALVTSVTRSSLSLVSGTIYYVTVRALGTTGEIIVQATSDGIVVDATAPSISNVSATPSNTTASIAWTTNEVSSSQVEYGLTASYGSASSIDPTLVTSHALALTGLASSTTYHYRVISVDFAGNTATSSDATFTTSDTASTPTMTIDNVRVVAGETIVTVFWRTSEASTSRIRYGRTSSLGSVVSNASAVTDHRLQITGLRSGTQYFYEIESIGSSIGVSAVEAFTTNTPNSRTNRAIGPTLYTPVLRDGAHPSIIVTGVARGGDVVRVYVDRTVVATMKMRGTNTQIKPFAARVKLDDFKNGRHTVHAQSTDTVGRTSFVDRRLAFVLTRQGADRGVITTKPRLYQVEYGDSPWRIAERYLGDGRRYREIIQANLDRFPSLRFVPSVLLPGWMIQLPPA